MFGTWNIVLYFLNLIRLLENDIFLLLFSRYVEAKGFVNGQRGFWQDFHAVDHFCKLYCKRYQQTGSNNGSRTCACTVCRGSLMIWFRLNPWIFTKSSWWKMLVFFPHVIQYQCLICLLFRFLNNLVLHLWDCGGQEAFMENYLMAQKDQIFKNVQVRRFFLLKKRY